MEQALMLSPVAPSIALNDAALKVWDVLVVGAGPAGSSCARLIAQRGISVLLVDKDEFPRPKICGCCLNDRSLKLLKSMGLAGLVPSLHGRSLNHLRLAAGGVVASISLPGGMAVSRDAFDKALIVSAIECGACFLPKTTATVSDTKDEYRDTVLHDATGTVTVSARLVIAADGLAGGSLKSIAELAGTAAAAARIGAGVIVSSDDSFYASNTIYMAVDASGYVGVVRLEDDRLNIAAALDPQAVARHQGPGSVAVEILRQSRLPAIDGLAKESWHGTPRLTTRRKSVAAHRLFVIGDAAGYTEPFTGEGISWALSCAQAAAPLAVQAVDNWYPELIQQWNETYGALIGHKQQSSRFISSVLKNGQLFGAAISILSKTPWLASPVVRLIST